MSTAFDQTIAVAGLLSKKSLGKLLKIGLIWSAVAAVFWIFVSLWPTGQIYMRIDNNVMGLQVQVLAIPLVALVITAFVVSIIMTASYSYAFIAQGATRKSVAIGGIVNAVVVTIAVGGIASIVYYIDALRNGGAIAASIAKALSVPTPHGWSNVVTAVLALSMLLLLGMNIAGLFLRWSWPVGLAVLIMFTSGIVPEIGHYLMPDLAASVARSFTMPIGPALASVALGLTYYAIMRKIPVR